MKGDIDSRSRLQKFRGVSQSPDKKPAAAKPAPTKSLRGGPNKAGPIAVAGPYGKPPTLGGSGTPRARRGRGPVTHPVRPPVKRGPR